LAMTTTSARTAQVAVSRRIVLAPWGSVNVISSYRGMAEAWKSPAAVVQPKGRTSGVSRSKPLTPSRAERRMRPVLSWRLHSCAYYFCTRGCGRIARPAFRAPSQSEGGTFIAQLGRNRVARSRSRIQSLPLFDIRIRTQPQSIVAIVMHDASTSTASSLRRQGPIRRVVYDVRSARHTAMKQNMQPAQ
jgi:hypothetical protein